MTKYVSDKGIPLRTLKFDEVNFLSISKNVYSGASVIWMLSFPSPFFRIDGAFRYLKYATCCHM